MAEKALSFAITPARVAFLLGLISLGGIGWTGVTWVNAREAYERTTDAAIEDVRDDFSKAIDAAGKSNEKLAGQVEKLSDAVTDLSLAVRTLQVQQDPRVGLLTK